MFAYRLAVDGNVAHLAIDANERPGPADSGLVIAFLVV